MKLGKRVPAAAPPTHPSPWTGHGSRPRPSRMDFKNYVRECREAVDAELQRRLPPEDQPPVSIHRAMRYSVFAGGKRLRPLLVLATGESFGAERAILLPMAAAIELIHTYSLVHDDLPAIDNDDLRRGRPTCHKVFGEAMAILVGDALLTLAFHTLADFAVPPALAGRKIEVIKEIAIAAGTAGGMIGGQVVDIESEGRTITPETLDYIHRGKTAALLAACVVSAAIIGGASPEERARLQEYGQKAGLAFQVIDDILDVEESSETLGKTAGKDAQQRKATYPAFWGLEKSKARAAELTAAAIQAIEPLGPRARPLVEIARLIADRRS